MRIDILTIFPDMFRGPLEFSIIKRAQEKGIVELRIIDIREFAPDKHHTTDDTPYGGGGGMVMKPEPVAGALEFALGEQEKDERTRVIYLSPQGKLFDQAVAKQLSTSEHLVLLCGRYEGIDERIVELYVDQEISIGDYVLSGGELAAMVVTEALVRLLPGAVGNEDSIRQDSFYEGLLDYPHYTRPEVFKDKQVPEILLSGHHKEVRRWRRKKALKRTLMRRPELLQMAKLSEEDTQLLEELLKELAKEEP